MITYNQLTYYTSYILNIHITAVYTMLYSLRAPSQRVSNQAGISTLASKPSSPLLAIVRE